MVFIAALAGQAGRPPATAAIDSPFETMVENVRQGRFRGYLALDTEGEPLAFS